VKGAPIGAFVVWPQISIDKKMADPGRNPTGLAFHRLSSEIIQRINFWLPWLIDRRRR
jgi:hypothetical protein